MPNYLAHYKKLCSTRKNFDRVKSDSTYYESHHIIPRSLGGKDTLDNLVLLTPKEHYIAHLLLYMHYKQEGGISFRKMAFALVSMASTKVKNRNFTLSSRQYERIREAAAAACKGRKVQDTINYRKPKSDKHKEAIRLARLQAAPRSLQTREKLAAIKRRKHPIQNTYKATCPFCSKTGQMIAMKRWHFQNCKEKEVVYA